MQFSVRSCLVAILRCPPIDLLNRLIPYFLIWLRLWKKTVTLTCVEGNILSKNMATAPGFLNVMWGITRSHSTWSPRAVLWVKEMFWSGECSRLSDYHKPQPAAFTEWDIFWELLFFVVHEIFCQSSHKILHYILFWQFYRRSKSATFSCECLQKMFCFDLKACQQQSVCCLVSAFSHALNETCPNPLVTYKALKWR